MRTHIKVMFNQNIYRSCVKGEQYVNLSENITFIYRELMDILPNMNVGLHLFYSEIKMESILHLSTIACSWSLCQHRTTTS